MTRHSKRACSALAIPKSVKFSYRIEPLWGSKELSLLVMYPYLLKRKLIWRFVQLPDLVTTSQDRFLYYLSVWKIFSKNSFFTQPQGVSLSIADAKVDTFQLLTKQSGDFFSRKIEEKSQLADFQDYQSYESLQAFSKSAISMLQNIKKQHICTTAHMCHHYRIPYYRLFSTMRTQTFPLITQRLHGRQ